MEPCLNTTVLEKLHIPKYSVVHPKTFCSFISGFNVQYRPSFTDESPVWFLGKCYDKRKLGWCEVFH